MHPFARWSHNYETGEDLEREQENLRVALTWLIGQEESELAFVRIRVSVWTDSMILLSVQTDSSQGDPCQRGRVLSSIAPNARNVAFCAWVKPLIPVILRRS